MLKAAASLIAGLVFAAGPALAQDYPNKVVRIMTSAAGGGGDLIARLVAQGLSKNVGQPVIVDNRGISAADAIAKAPPDGYNLLFYGSNVWVSPLVRKTTWDPVRDFAPIMLVADAVNVLVINAAIPAKDVKELIAYAKSRPGQINFASSAAGSATHLAGELFKSMTGIDIVHVPYKGVSAAYADLVAGRVQMMFGNAGSVAGHAKSGKLRILAIGNEQLSALLPGVPTVAATVPGFSAGVPYALFAPAKTPAAIINRINQGVAAALKDPDTREKLAQMEVEVIASTPAQLATKVNNDVVQLGKIIKDAGISEN
jgi:tripartite-type tricarboxylate transporter receptor subunit TctC